MQLSLIKAAAHKGGICLIILALTEVCTDNFDSQPLLVWCQRTVRVCLRTCVPSINAVVCLLLLCLDACSCLYQSVLFPIFIFFSPIFIRERGG